MHANITLMLTCQVTLRQVLKRRICCYAGSILVVMDIARTLPFVASGPISLTR
jgi:hypothetical protein